MCVPHDTPAPELALNDRLRKLLVLGAIAFANYPLSLAELLEVLEHGLSEWRLRCDLDCLLQRARIREEDDGRWTLL